jgi:hypothetical protein
VLTKNIFGQNSPGFERHHPAYHFQSSHCDWISDCFYLEHPKQPV